MFWLTFVLKVYNVLTKRYWTILNHFRIIKCVLLDNNKSEMNQIYLIDNKAGYFAPLTFLKLYLHLIKRWKFLICLLSVVNHSLCFNIIKTRLCKFTEIFVWISVYCAAPKLQCMIRSASHWTIINILKRSFVGYFFLFNSTFKLISWLRMFLLLDTTGCLWTSL